MASVLQQVNMINSAASLAQQLQAAFDALTAYQGQIAFSGTPAAIVAAGTAGFEAGQPNIPGPLTGFNPATFTTFNTQTAALLAAIQASSGAIGAAVQQMAEYGPAQ